MINTIDGLCTELEYILFLFALRQTQLKTMIKIIREIFKLENNC